MVNRLVKILDKLLDTVIVVVCILLLLIGVYSLLDNLWLYEHAQDRSVLLYKPSQDEPLSEELKISKNHVAWLSLDDTDIDYPVMQGADNYEFLNKDPYGDFSLSGSIFLDSRNDPAFTDEYSLIYGHHMARGAMFGALDAYRDESYFDTHAYGQLITGDRVYRLELFAVCSADATDSTVFNPSEQTIASILRFLREHATIFHEPEADRPIVALSTCSGDTSLERLLVFGTIRDTTEGA